MKYNFVVLCILAALLFYRLLSFVISILFDSINYEFLNLLLSSLDSEFLLPWCNIFYICVK